MFDYVKKMFTTWMGGKSSGANQTPRVIGRDEHGINPKKVSSAARRTVEALQSRGYKAYIVGGAVRDLLLGVTPKDFDVATDATPEQVKRAQRRAYIIGRRFRLVHVVYGDEIIECSTFRALDAAGQRKDASGRVISDNVFGEMWEDAARRDFTINALYYDPTSGEVLDYHGGYEDIRRRRLAMIGDPMERYREDPVRMMRAVRIATKLGFHIESATERAIPKMAKNLENVPAARLFDEMMKLFTCGHAESCLIKLRKEGLHRSLLPMLDVILKEKEGEEFLMLALRRTDERIASGKKISPAFLFATLLWPQVLKRWQAYEARPKMIRSKALYAAADDVVATQCAKLAIQNRFVADMKLIWMLQLRFERRTGKNPYTLTEHVKYRAGYDFMLLRSLLGQVPQEQVRWWETFVEADDDKRRAMIAEEERAARRTGDKARAGNKQRQEERFEADTVERLTFEQMPAAVRRREKSRNKRKAPSRVANDRVAETKREVNDETRFGTFAAEPAVQNDLPVIEHRNIEAQQARKRPVSEEIDQKPQTPVEVKESAPKRRRTAKKPRVEKAAPNKDAGTEVLQVETAAKEPRPQSEGLVQIETRPEYRLDAVEEKPAAEVEKPAKTTRKRTKKTTVTAEVAATSDESQKAPSEEVKEVKAPRKKAVRTKRAAKVEPTAVTEVTEGQPVVETQQPTVEAVVAEAPKRRTRSKVKKEVKEDASQPATEKTPEKAPRVAKPRRRTKKTEVSESASEKPVEKETAND